ncbi:MAG TPA: lectin-like protein [Polyangiaceae bacterium]|nr:lectin-like protein [Polyangiaceae bacterium]
MIGSSRAASVRCRSLWVFSLAFGVACGSSNSGSLFTDSGGTRASSGGNDSTSGGAVGASFSSGGVSQGGSITPPTSGSGGTLAGNGGTAGNGNGGVVAGGNPSNGGQGSGGTDSPAGGRSSGGAGAAASGGSATGGANGGGKENGGAGGDGAGASSGAGQGGVGGAGCEPSGQEICDGIDNDCNGRIDNGSGACPSGCMGRVLDGKGYMFCLTASARTPERASTACADNDMHLVWLETAKENAAVLAEAQHIAGSVTNFWIGASDGGTEGAWRWVEDGSVSGTQFWSGQASGMPVDGHYVNWSPNRPDHGAGEEDCVSFAVDRSGFPAGTWDDEPCSSMKPFVCEAP